MDMSADAIRFARTRCDRPMFLGDITRVPLRTRWVDLVTAFDIVEHVEDDGAALAELARVRRPGGHTLLMRGLAFQFLWGNQDVVSHQNGATRCPSSAPGSRAPGFRVVTISYFNALLFPIVAAVRVGRQAAGRAPCRG